MKKTVMILMLVAASAFAQDAASTPAQTTAAPLPFGVELEIGAGWDQLFNADFASFLSSNGMTAIDPLRTWRLGWRFAYLVRSFYVALGQSRTTNFFFGPYGATQRTKLAWDATDLTAGLKVVSTDTVTWSIGAGVGVSRVLLQAYGSAPVSFPAAYAGGGTIDLVSDWNWSPEAETFFGVRLLPLESTTSLWLRAGIQAGWLPLDSVWKLFDDPQVTGVPKPFDWFLRFSLWVGVQS
jgi:hypothetical protein